MRQARSWTRHVLQASVACAALFMTGAAAGQTPPPVAAPQAVADTDAQRIQDVVLANHILANQKVLDGFGHVSVRSASNPRHFFMARARGPGLVTADDIMEFDENSQPVDQRGRAIYSERFIHGEIFRARPDVNAIVHSHSPAVVPFSVTKTPFRAVIHVAGFLGAKPAPVWEIRDIAGPDNNMLVKDARTGADLAKSLGTGAVVLMRGHGMAVVGPTVKLAVMRAIYTQLNAEIEAQALQLGTPVYLNAAEAARIDPVDRPWEVWVADAEAARSR